MENLYLSVEWDGLFKRFRNTAPPCPSGANQSDRASSWLARPQVGLITSIPDPCMPSPLTATRNSLTSTSTPAWRVTPSTLGRCALPGNNGYHSNQTPCRQCLRLRVIACCRRPYSDLIS